MATCDLKVNDGNMWLKVNAGNMWLKQGVCGYNNFILFSKWKTLFMDKPQACGLWQWTSPDVF